MKPIRAPFGILARGPAVTWPVSSRPSTRARPGTRRPEVWERLIDQDSFPGELGLADLETVTECDDALLILARYLTVRVAWHACRGQQTSVQTTIDRDAACRYMEEMEGQAQERRWLSSILESVGNSRAPGRNTIARMNAAANAASKRGHVNGAHSLHATAWAIATSRGWHAEACRVAESIAAAAARGGARRSRRLWMRRARIQQARSES